MLGDYRLGIKPERAEKLILSAAKFRSPVIGQNNLNLPDTGVFEDDENQDLINIEMDEAFELNANDAHTGLTDSDNDDEYLDE